MKNQNFKRHRQARDDISLLYWYLYEGEKTHFLQMILWGKAFWILKAHESLKENKESIDSVCLIILNVKTGF